MIDIVHSNAKRLLATSQVTVYIDGKERLSANLKYPSASDVSLSSLKKRRKIWKIACQLARLQNFSFCHLFLCMLRQT